LDVKFRSQRWLWMYILFEYKFQVTKMVLDVIYVFGCLLNPILERKVLSLGPTVLLRLRLQANI
jgi:hypothetical protein